MQDLSETLELIRLSIYISFVITGGTFLYFAGLFLFRLNRKIRTNRYLKDRTEQRLQDLEMKTFDVQMYLEKSSKGKFKPDYE